MDTKVAQPIIYAFIFARGGSKGVPRKNIRLLGGKPLIAHAIETAQQVQGVKRIIVSTDDVEIAAIAKEWGAEVPFMRPAELAADNASEWLAWQHALREVGCSETKSPCDIFLSLPCTAPLRSVEDVEKCIAEYKNHACDAVVTASPAARHPMFNMLVRDEHGEAHLAMAGEQAFTRRQDAPAMYDMTTVAYVFSPRFILQHTGVLEGRVRMVEIPRERAVDIDEELDFIMAETILLKTSGN